MDKLNTIKGRIGMNKRMVIGILVAFTPIFALLIYGGITEGWWVPVLTILSLLVIVGFVLLGVWIYKGGMTRR